MGTAYTVCLMFMTSTMALVSRPAACNMRHLPRSSSEKKCDITAKEQLLQYLDVRPYHSCLVHTAASVVARGQCYWVIPNYAKGGVMTFFVKKVIMQVTGTG